MRFATVRECRLALGSSQSAFAASLAVPIESYRPWDSGRREPPEAVLVKAQILAAAVERERLLPLELLARMVGTHVRTLRAAARDGRLPVIYHTRTTFRRLRARATLADATRFRQTRFREHVPVINRPAPPSWATIPSDYDQYLRDVRARLHLSQRALAWRIGAAGKAVVYQWESRKRTPSPILWARILILACARRPAREATGRPRGTLLPPATERMCPTSRRDA